jgi:uncharacterized protein YqeY
MSLQAKIETDLTAAMKAKTEPDRTVLRSLIAALKNEQIAQGGDLDEPAETAVLKKQLKQRQESAEAYGDQRPEMAKQEQVEATIIERYLPEQMSDHDLSAAVEAVIKEVGAAGPGDIGKVMGALKAKLGGKADLGQASALVKQKLG